MKDVVFLVDNFTDYICNLGESRETVLRFKDDINKLVKSGSIRKEDTVDIFKMLCIWNVSNLDWKLIDNKVAQFRIAMNYLYDMRNKEQLDKALLFLMQMGTIDCDSSEYIKKIVKRHRWF